MAAPAAVTAASAAASAAHAWAAAPPPTQMHGCTKRCGTTPRTISAISGKHRSKWWFQQFPCIYLGIYRGRVNHLLWGLVVWKPGNPNKTFKRGQVTVSSKNSALDIAKLPPLGTHAGNPQAKHAAQDNAFQAWRADSPLRTHVPHKQGQAGSMFRN